MNNGKSSNNKNNSSDMNPAVVAAMLKMASGKLGTTPDKLKSQLESGSTDKLLSSMDSKQAQMLKQALADKKTAEKILSSPQAQELMKKLSGK